MLLCKAYFCAKGYNTVHTHLITEFLAQARTHTHNSWSGFICFGKDLGLDLFLFKCFFSKWGKYTPRLPCHTLAHIPKSCQFRSSLYTLCIVWLNLQDHSVCMRLRVYVCVCSDKRLFSDMLSSPHCKSCYVVFNNSQANSTLTRAWKLNDYLPFCTECVCASAPMGLRRRACVCVRILVFFMRVYECWYAIVCVLCLLPNVFES